MAMSRSPRLPGIHLLALESTGPQYARWRRSAQEALAAKGSWGHCDGTTPMPMPESGPNFFSPTSTTSPKPELLDERKAWAKQDREVKMDIFLSVSDDIKLEVFETGPPLPPTTMSAAEMMKALDAAFGGFKFEDFHHVFCHFLNLHIDMFPNLAEFNVEFVATLDDLLDHGYPLDNLQACSAYFSKLRCTQNPWVAKQLKTWDAQSTPPQLEDLMKDCPEWMVIRPRAAKKQQLHSVPETYAEEDLMAPSITKSEDEDHATSSESENSEILTPSSTPPPQSHVRNISVQSREITIGASLGDITFSDFTPPPPFSIPELTTHPKRKTKRLSLMPRIPPPPPPMNRPLPPLPRESIGSRAAAPRSLLSLKSPSLPVERPQAPTSFPRQETTPRRSNESTKELPVTPLPGSPEPNTPRASTPTPSVGSTRSSSKGAAKMPLQQAPSTPPTKSLSSQPTTPPSLSASTPPTRPSSSHETPSQTLLSTPTIPTRPASSRGHNTSKPGSLDSISTWPPPRHSSLNPGALSSSSPSIIFPLASSTPGSKEPEYHDTILSGSNLGGINSSGSGVGAIWSGPASAMQRSFATEEGAKTRSSSPKGLVTAAGPGNGLSASPAKGLGLSLMGRMSQELFDEVEEKKRKRTWSLKVMPKPSMKLGRRIEVQEMI